jgi:hypothetical protein
VVANLIAEPPRPTVILGAPGIGKTNLALAALHDTAVSSPTGERRYFVRCEGASSAQAVVTELARVMGLPLLAGDLLAGCLAELAATPALVCLDNAETPWEADTLSCERLFEHLAAAGALLASLRGAERPGGPAWAPPVRLLPLDGGDARALFLAASGGRFDEPGLGELLEEMGRVPLAVELLARAAEGEASLDHVASRWRAERVGLLARGGGNHPLLSVAVSVEVSWGSRLMTEPARRLLALLGRLPERDRTRRPRDVAAGHGQTRRGRAAEPSIGLRRGRPPAHVPAAPLPRRDRASAHRPGLAGRDRALLPSRI